MNAALQATLEFLKLYWAPLLCGVAVVAILPLIVGYIVLVERKIMADMQARLGPMRVGPHGLLQPIADAGETAHQRRHHPGERWTNSSSGSRRCFPLGRGCFRWLAWRSDRHFRSRRTLTLAFSSLWASARWEFLASCWRLGFEQPLFADGSVAQFGAVGELRDRRGDGAGERAFIYGHAEYQIDRGSAEQRRHLVRAARAGGFFYLPGRLHCGDQPGAVRFAGSRVRAGRRVHDGVQWIPLVALFSRRIHQHDRGGVGCDDAIFWAVGCVLLPACTDFPVFTG